MTKMQKTSAGLIRIGRPGIAIFSNPRFVAPNNTQQTIRTRLIGRPIASTVAVQLNRPSIHRISDNLKVKHLVVVQQWYVGDQVNAMKTTSKSFEPNEKNGPEQQQNNDDESYTDRKLRQRFYTQREKERYRQ